MLSSVLRCETRQWCGGKRRLEDEWEGARGIVGMQHSTNLCWAAHICLFHIWKAPFPVTAYSLFISFDIYLVQPWNPLELLPLALGLFSSR